MAFSFSKWDSSGAKAPLRAKTNVGSAGLLLNLLHSLDVLSNILGLLVAKPRDTLVMWSLA